MDLVDQNLVPASDFQLQQEIMLLETSYGHSYFTGPVRIAQTLPHKICIQLSNGKNRLITDIKPLHPMDEFGKEGEGYVLKENIISTLEHPEDEDIHQDQISEDPEQCYRNLIRSTRRKARELI